MTGLAQSTSSTRIYLFKLNKTEDALIRRVINFAINQGKPYCLQTDLQQADIIIADVLSDLPTHHAVEIILEKSAATAINPTIKPKEQNRTLNKALNKEQNENKQQRYYLSRPLLVTRTMRLLDQVAANLPKLPKPEESIKPPTQTALPTITKPTPIPTTTSIQTPAKANPTALTEPTAKPQIENQVTNRVINQTASKPSSLLKTPSIAPLTTHTKPEKPSPQITEPQDIQPKTLSPKNTKPEPKPEPQKNYRYKALVVDDSAAIRKQLELELTETDIFAEFAESGEQAIEKSDKTLYDLVFLDVILPEMDGYAVCRHLRANPKMKKTPIIMLSGKTSPMDEVKGVIAGASTYLTKPIKHTQFQNTLKRVSRWLGHYQAN